VAGVTGAPAGPDLVRVIAERSAGNPFLVTELARQLAGPEAGPAAARAVVPDSVRALAGRGYRAQRAHRRRADALIEVLTGAYGLGGRVRRSGSAAERARTAVTARIRDAIRRIGGAHPELGRHLARSVRTGTFCVYEPDQPARWSL
jgi:hypothetical protein